MLTFDFSEAQSIFGYNFFLLAAMLATFALYIKEGQRLHFPMTTWLTVVAVVNVLLVVGSRLGAFSSNDWLALFSGASLPDHAQKTALGGLVLGLAGYFVLQRQFRLPLQTADLFFLGLPLAAMVGRMGCTVAGCCFGLPTDVPWAVRYGQASSVFQWHAAEGVIGSDATSSLPVHPVQLYLILGNLLIFSILLLVRSRLRMPGSLALLSLALLMGNRFFSEFFRDILTNRGLTGLVWGGMKGAQWLALLLSLAATLLFAHNEKRPVQAARGRVFRELPLSVPAAWLAALAVFAFLSRHWLTFVEEWLVLVSIAPAFGRVLWQVWLARKNTVGALAPAGLLSVAALALTELPRDSMLPFLSPPLVGGYREPQNWVEIGGGGTFGHFKDIDRDCNGDIIRERKIRNLSAGAEVSFHHRLGENSEVAGGIRGGLGGARDVTNSPGESGNYTVFGPFLNLESKPVGLSIGCLFAPEATRRDFYQNPFIEVPYFTGGLRLGLRHRYYFDAQVYNQHSFSYFPHPSISIASNWGFDDRSGRTLVRAGMAVMGSSASFMAAGRFPLGNSNLTGDCSLFLGKESMISAGVRYRIPMKWD